MKSVFTEDNGVSFCIAKVMAALAFVAYLAYATYGLFQGHFALQEFANGLMMVLGGSAVIIAGKQITQKT